MHQAQADFVATGLVPVPITTPSQEQDDCPICVCPLTTPVKTPCNHVYDRDCIETWLGAKHNTCPLCKTVLFHAQQQQQQRSHRSARQQQISTALQTSNVLSREPPFANFGSTEYNLSSLQRSVAQASFALGRGRAPVAGEWVQVEAPGVLVRVVGPCVIDVQTLSPALIAMANLLPALAHAEGRGFDAATKSGWEVVCRALWLEITAMTGRKIDAMVLPSMLKMKTRDAVEKQQRGGAAMSFFEMTGSNGECFDTLLNFLAFRAWETQQESEKREAAAREARRLRIETREEPKM